MRDSTGVGPDENLPFPYQDRARRPAQQDAINGAAAPKVGDAAQVPGAARAE
eukprot:CAMPEP_0170603600 /NCGR_PEP_ID=MMETSP0224-20130122/18996_1 /TAXON_ID=285029 /ORGANISM="Togula jolla, Strain CCCM 725" /LENGTH=51 /DNA_ID=CAMNT_0010928487 /DNA_START=863 /DNA_END=1015 /DNA_ORIENTATION=-